MVSIVRECCELSEFRAPALDVSGGFDVEFPSDLFEFRFGAEDQHETEISSDFEAVGFHYVHNVVAEGLLALVGVGHAKTLNPPA